MPKLKEKNLRQLIDFIASKKFGFDMNDPMYETRCESRDCGSAGCIGSHAAVIWPDVRLRDSDGEVWTTTSAKDATGARIREQTFDDLKLAKKLGLSDDDLQCLCYPDGLPYYDATPDQAVRVLQHLLRTGTVDWTESGIEMED